MPKITSSNAREIGEKLARDLPGKATELALGLLIRGLCETANVEPLAQVVMLLCVCRRVESASGRNDLLYKALEASAVIAREQSN